MILKDLLKKKDKHNPYVTDDKIKDWLPILSDHFNKRKIIPTRDKDGNRSKIKVWFDNQMQNYRDGKLNPDRLNL